MGVVLPTKISVKIEVPIDTFFTQAAISKSGFWGNRPFFYLLLIPSLCSFTIILTEFQFKLILIIHYGVMLLFRKVFHCYYLENEQEV